VRGGVVIATAPHVTDRAPRCTWRGEPLPCHATSGGTRAIVPLPADLAAGSHALVIEGGGSRVERQIAVADTTFERVLVFLAPPQFALLGRRADIARDARAVQQALARESAEQRWSGAWREPVAGLQSSTGFGAERFYHAASDSARALRLRPEMRAATSFGTDTAPPAEPSAAASWRHAGLDVPVSVGTVIRAPAAGVVTDVGQYVLTGGTLVVDHGHGVSTAYFHLDSVLVRQGDEVRAGQSIARSGNDGLTTGPHLHYGVYVHGHAVDPRGWHEAMRRP
jgi:murein DD-endopeptidase MepM/ murein hydrolase activator NlpD